jgi:hypothetical protein
MATHIVQSLGYSQCPEFADLAKARKHLRDLVKESLARARRTSKTATKHRVYPDYYRITLGSDERSTLYALHQIISQ